MAEKRRWGAGSSSLSPGDFMRKLANSFESFLFHSRFVTLLAVLGALFSSVIMFGMGTMKIVSSVAMFWSQITGSQGTVNNLGSIVALFVSSVDIYLFATVLLIFSNGLYELFIKRIDIGQYPESRRHWLKVHSLDDLKASLGKVILMILIVWFFEKSLTIEYATALDLLYLGVGILLISAALYLTHAGDKSQMRHTDENAA
ncbi:MAG: YqhA family protein [Deltaproteobacteria bacterium]|jgi:uncharacterized membrane protein YqhA|nr:YqhA family protein [Deltaproteobacteria bacterium]